MKSYCFTSFILLLMLCAHIGMAQQSNPFELKYRIQVPKKEKEEKVPVKEVKIVPIKSNPFDVKKQANQKLETGVKTKPIIVLPTIEEIQREKGEDFLFWILILDLLFLSVVINLNRSTLLSIFKAVRNDSYMSLLAKSTNMQSRLQYNLYFLLYVINLGLFLYISLKTMWGVQGIMWILKSIAIVLGVYIVRMLGLKVLSFVYPVKRETDVFSYTIKIFSSFIMFFLVAINFCLAFVPEVLVQPFIYFGIVLIAGSYILRQLRGIFIGINYITQSPSHFFLYLCTFEIAPFIIGYKFIETMG